MNTGVRGCARWCAAWVVCVCWLGGCAAEDRRPTAGPPRADGSPRRLQQTSAPLGRGALHNLVAFGPGLTSGAAPEGDAGFDELREMGVRTIVSVDGAAPDVGRAQARGMRYVHLPIGYDGVSDERGLELARAVRDLPGPVYLHCHHGKHRAPAAAGVVAVSLGRLTAEEAHARLVGAGTAPNYEGLYACVAAATVKTRAQIDAASGTFPEVARPDGLVAAMLRIDEAFDHLKLIEKAGWLVPADHPDLVPAAEAGVVAECVRLSVADGATVAAWGGGFAEHGAASLTAARALEAALAASTPDRGAATMAMKRLAASCTDCHGVFRDRRGRDGRAGPG